MTLLGAPPPRTRERTNSDRENAMKRPVLIALLGTLGATAACGSDHQSNSGGATTPICKGPPSDSCFLPVANVPFVIRAGTVTDGVSTARITNPAPGTVCLSGTLADAGPTYANWGAILVLDIAAWNQERTQVSPFPAEQLGITQVQFTLDSPPATGIAPAVMEVLNLECPNNPGDCLTAVPFYLKSEVITTARTITASLSAAEQPSWGDPRLMLDPNRVYGLQFDGKTTQGTTADYDFCVHDLKFLGADGTEIVPAR
jgi:hypothetical protein